MDVWPSATIFDSFNSLSRDHKYTTILTLWTCPKPFNSLSRDHEAVTAQHELFHDLEEPFNSLSRDHETFFALITMALGILLSTPSLGITEPDSGIFRLSAAFCRGTFSHK